MSAASAERKDSLSFTLSLLALKRQFVCYFYFQAMCFKVAFKGLRPSGNLGQILVDLAGV